MRIHSTARVHPTAIVADGARLGAGCIVGPFCTVGSDVELCINVHLKSHVVVSGRTRLGEDCVVFPFAVVGEVPQDMKYRGENTRLEIGKRNRIREGATLNIGTSGGGGVTRVGDDNLFMTGAHVGHDVQVGNRVVMANQAALAGHCIIGDDVIIGGLAGIHQHVRIGNGAIIGAITKVTNDVIPNGLVQGPRGELDGLNLIGLKRRGAKRADITALRAAYRSLARGEGAFVQRAARLRDETDNNLVREVTEFILAGSERSFLIPN
ncbi:MAG: acyl-ACP--UDP-N-acetylglucosamine O-acyltransferase [Paracoccaceae bacterium]